MVLDCARLVVGTRIGQGRSADKGIEEWGGGRSRGFLGVSSRVGCKGEGATVVVVASIYVA